MFERLRWPRIALCGLGAVLSNWVLVFLVVTVYAVMLGFQAMGPPDQDRIQAFAQWIGPRLGLPAALALATLFGWLAARATDRPQAHGVAVGVVGALVGLGLALLGGPALGELAGVALVLAGGVLGGRLTRGTGAAVSRGVTAVTPG